MRSLAAAAVLTLAFPGAASAAQGSAPAGAAPAPGGAPASPHAAPAAPGKPAAKPPAKPVDVDKALYGIGLVIARNLETFDLSRAELDKVLVGVRDGVAGKPKVAMDAQLQASINELARVRVEKAGEKEKAAGAPYLAKMAADPRAKKTASGVIVIPVQEGSGPSPQATDTVEVNYTGTLVNGTVFDTSKDRGPAKFPLDKVVRCWTEALQTMKVGGKAKVVCPAETAYGPMGSPPRVPGNAVLTFDVELLGVSKG